MSLYSIDDYIDDADDPWRSFTVSYRVWRVVIWWDRAQANSYSSSITKTLTESQTKKEKRNDRLY